MSAQASTDDIRAMRHTNLQ